MILWQNTKQMTHTQLADCAGVIVTTRGYAAQWKLTKIT